MASEDPFDDLEDDGVALQHRRPFGSGLRRKQIVFVPASSGDLNSTEENTSATASTSVADAYLDIVLPKNPSCVIPDTAPLPLQMCEVCQLPLDETPVDPAQVKSVTRRHETSIAHQVCLAHSHPPSALDRRRMGLSVLQSQGWDPDSRSGLGIAQQGMQYPIKVTPKDDKLGIGLKVPKDLEARRKAKVQKLDAGKARNMAAEDKKRREKLQRQFYGNGDLEKYLGSV